jgi:G3E family GTPase
VALIPITLLTGADAQALEALSQSLDSTAWIVHDPALLEGPLEFTACACCRLGTSITSSLLDLLRKRSRGEHAAFDRILITATAGQAAEALAELARSPMVGASCRIASVATYDREVDARIADHRLDRVVSSQRDWLEGHPLAIPLNEPHLIRAEHDQSIESFVIGWDGTPGMDAIGPWLLELTDRVGGRLLRLHGRVETPEGVFGIEASGHALAPPAAGLPAGRRGTRLRLVTVGLEPGDLLPAWPTGAARDRLH